MVAFFVFVVVALFILVVMAFLVLVVVAFLVLVVVAFLVLVVMALFVLAVTMDLAFHGALRVGRLHDNRGQVVANGVDRAVHPGLEPDPVHHDHVRVAQRQQVGCGGFESVGLDAGAYEHVDLGPVTADTFGEVAQRINRGHDLEAVGIGVAFSAGSCESQHSENRDDRDAESHGPGSDGSCSRHLVSL